MDLQTIVDDTSSFVQDYLAEHLPKLSRIVNPFVPFVLTLALRVLVSAVTKHPEVQSAVARFKAELPPVVD